MSVAAGGGRVLLLQRQAKTQADRRDENLREIEAFVTGEGPIGKGGIRHADREVDGATGRLRDARRALRESQSVPEEGESELPRRAKRAAEEEERSAEEAKRFAEDQASRLRWDALDACRPGMRVGDLAHDAKIRGRLLGHRGRY